MTLLISGVALWWAAHLFKRLMPGVRGKLGDPGKGLMAVMIVAWRSVIESVSSTATRGRSSAVDP